MDQSIYVATGNKDKLKEMFSFCREYLPEYQNIVARAAQDAEETGLTFIDNAKIKAHALFRELSSEGFRDFCIVADDSGICVDLLDGAPGIFSARYAKSKANALSNVDKLLEDLFVLSTKIEDRTAHYRCALCFLDVRSGEVYRELTSEGILEGLLALKPEGAGGFGYDPIFLDPKSRVSYAEISQSDKNECSHRQKAFFQLSQKL